MSKTESLFINNPHLEIFEDVFEDALLQELAGCPFMQLPPKTVLRDLENSSMRHTPLVVEGSIKVSRIDETGKEILLYYIHPGESCFLSITASLNNNFTTIDALHAVTETDCNIIYITDEHIRRWNDQYKSWRQYVAHLYNSRFIELFSIIDAIAFKSVDVRLLAHLKMLSSDHKEINITHQELAKQIGTAREVVSRLLKNLEMNDKVRLMRGKIEVIRL